MGDFQGIGKDDPRLGQPVRIGQTQIKPYVEVVVVMPKMPSRFRAFLGILLVRIGTVLLMGRSRILLNVRDKNSNPTPQDVDRASA